MLVLDAPGSHPRWVADRFGRVLERCARDVLGRRHASRSSFDRRPSAGAGAGHAGRRRRRRRRRPTSTPATASSSSSSATATASRTPPRWRSPSSRARPTTRSSSTPRRASARPTCCTRSATTCSRFGGGTTRPLHDRRGVHEPLHRARSTRKSLDALQARLPRRRRAADRRRPVSRQQGEDRGGVLPHLQRALRGRAPARAHLRPAAAPADRRSRSGCASASRPGWSPTSSRRTSRRAWRSSASGPRSTASRSPTRRVLDLIAERVHRQHPLARGGADPGRRLPLADRRPIDLELATDGPRRDLPARRRRSRLTSIDDDPAAVVAAHYALSTRRAHLTRAEQSSVALAAPGGDPPCP